MLATLERRERLESMNEDLIKIRSELYRREIEHREIAKMIGISAAYLSDILRGKRNGKKAQEHIKRICKILGV